MPFTSSEVSKIYIYFSGQIIEFILVVNSSGGELAWLDFSTGYVDKEGADFLTAQEAYSNDPTILIYRSSFGGDFNPNIPEQLAQIPNAVIDANPFMVTSQDSESTPEPALAIFYHVSAAPASTITTPNVSWNAATGEWTLPAGWDTEHPDLDATTPADNLYYSIRQGGVTGEPIIANPNFVLYSATPDGANASATFISGTHHYWGVISGNGQVVHWYPVEPGEEVIFFNSKRSWNTSDLGIIPVTNFNLDDYHSLLFRMHIFTDATDTDPVVKVAKRIPTADIVPIHPVSSAVTNLQHAINLVKNNNVSDAYIGEPDPSASLTHGEQAHFKLHLLRASSDTEPNSRAVTDLRVYSRAPLSPDPRVRIIISANKGQ